MKRTLQLLQKGPVTRCDEMGGSLANTDLPAAVSSAGYNAANRLTNWGGINLSYDLNGNLSGDGAKTYAWDERNRLASLTGVSFGYDPFGRRISKTVSGTSTGFLYDGLNMVQELSGSTPSANILTGLNIDEFFGRIDSAGARYFMTDALNSTLALTDSSGAIKTSYSYDPYGNTTASGSASSNSFQYTGRENDQTGLYFYRARYYSSLYDRFISEDPIGLAGGINSYAYVGGNPIIYSDPFGLFNPAKGFSALGNAAISGSLAASGSIKIAIAAGLSPASSTGVGALPPAALLSWGTWNLKSSFAAWQRAQQQWGEAMCEQASQAAWKNLYGMLPGGTNYDDPGEAGGPLEYIQKQGWWKFIRDFGYF